MSTIRNGLPVVSRRVKPVDRAEFPADLRRQSQQEQSAPGEDDDVIDVEFEEVPMEHEPIALLGDDDFGFADRVRRTVANSAYERALRGEHS